MVKSSRSLGSVTTMCRPYRFNVLYFKGQLPIDHTVSRLESESPRVAGMISALASDRGKVQLTPRSMRRLSHKNSHNMDRLVPVMIRPFWMFIMISLLPLSACNFAHATSSSKHDVNFGSETEDNPPFHSSWIEMLTSSRWEVWQHRILVTIAIVVVWEFLLQPKRQERQASAGQRPPTMNSHAKQKRLQRNADDDLGKTQQEFKRRGEEAAFVTTGGGDFEEEVDTVSPSKKRTTTYVNEKSSIMKADNDAEPSDIKKDENMESKQVLDGRDDSSLPTKEEVPVSSLKEIEPSDTATLTADEPSSSPRQPNKGGARTVAIRSTATSTPPRIRATTNEHPGMSGFSHWYEVETSLYRVYTLTRKDGEQVVPPYIPHSYRGNVNIFLHITNSTSHVINVYWVDYKGSHVLKGTVKPNHVWTQSTWIDHRKSSSQQFFLFVSI